MAQSSLPWLTLAIFTPIVFGLLVLATGREHNPNVSRVLALIGSIAGLIVTIPLIAGFNAGTADMQFVENTAWVAQFGIYYHLGIQQLFHMIAGHFWRDNI